MNSQPHCWKERCINSDTWVRSRTYVAPHSHLQLVANTDDQGNDADTKLLGDRCCYKCRQTLCEWDTIGVLVLDNVESEYIIQSAPENGYVSMKSTGE